MVPPSDWAVWLLEALTGNHQAVAITVFTLLPVLAVWRRKAYGAFPTLEECASLAQMVVQAYVGVILTLVLAFTYPPRFDLVSPPTLVRAGAYVAILTLYNVVPGIGQLLLPKPPPVPPPVHAKLPPVKIESDWKAKAPEKSE